MIKPWNTICPKCKNTNAYQGFAFWECPDSECENYSLSQAELVAEEKLREEREKAKPANSTGFIRPPALSGSINEENLHSDDDYDAYGFYSAASDDDWDPVEDHPVFYDDKDTSDTTPIPRNCNPPPAQDPLPFPSLDPKDYDNSDDVDTIPTYLDPFDGFDT